MSSVFPPGATLSARYRIARVLAHGPLASLHEARDLSSGARVAFKWLRLTGASPTELDVLVERARAAVRLEHADVAAVYEVVREQDSVFAVRELLRGEPYSHYLASHLLPIDQRIAAMTAVARAVAAAHDARVSHLGLHPDNVFLLDREGGGPRIKLMDFGCNQTQGATLLGRPARVPAGHHVYMAPEQLERAGELDARSDVYAYAVLLYQALTGVLPFAGDTPEALQEAWRTGAEPALACELRDDVPSALAELLHACLARRVELRPARLDALIPPLEQLARTLAAQEGTLAVPSGAATILRSEPVWQPMPASPRDPPGTRARRVPRKPRWDMIALGALGTASLVLALAALPRMHGPRRAPVLPPPLPAPYEFAPHHAEVELAPADDRVRDRERRARRTRHQPGDAQPRSRARRTAAREPQTIEARTPQRVDSHTPQRVEPHAPQRVERAAAVRNEEPFRAGRPLTHDDF